MPPSSLLIKDFNSHKLFLSIKKNEDGFNYLIEFVAAMFIFIIVVVAYYTALENQFSIKDKSDDVRVMTAMRILDTLTTQPGLAGNTTEWEKLSPETLEKDLIEVGFAFSTSWSHYDIYKERNETNLSSTHGNTMLDAAKINALRNVTYEKMKEIFHLDYREMELRITPLQVTNLSAEQMDYLTIDFGVNSTEAKVKSTVERIFPVSFLNVKDPALLKHSNYTAVSIKCTLLEGIVDYPRIVINEINYAPYTGDQREEWVELYNTNDCAVNLSSWTIEVEEQKQYFTPVRGTLFLRGKSYAVVCSDSDVLLSNYKVNENATIYIIEDAVFGVDSLPDENGTIILEGGIYPRDEVTYSSSDGGGPETKKTLERVSIYKTLFKESINEGGTPGFKNSI